VLECAGIGGRGRGGAGEISWSSVACALVAHGMARTPELKHMYAHSFPWHLSLRRTARLEGDLVRFVSGDVAAHVCDTVAELVRAGEGGG